MHLFSPLHMPHAFPIHIPWSDPPNNVQWAVQIMNLLTMHFPPTSCYFFPLQYKHLPQHHRVANPSSVFFLHIERLFSCPDKTMHKMVVLFKFCQLHFRTFSFVTTHISESARPPQYVKFILISLFLDCKWEGQNIFNWMVVSTP